MAKNKIYRLWGVLLCLACLQRRVRVKAKFWNSVRRVWRPRDSIACSLRAKGSSISWMKSWTTTTATWRTSVRVDELFSNSEAGVSEKKKRTENCSPIWSYIDDRLSTIRHANIFYFHLDEAVSIRYCCRDNSMSCCITTKYYQPLWQVIWSKIGIHWCWAYVWSIARGSSSELRSASRLIWFKSSVRLKKWLL